MILSFLVCWVGGLYCGWVNSVVFRGLDRELRGMIDGVGSHNIVGRGGVDSVVERVELYLLRTSIGIRVMERFAGGIGRGTLKRRMEGDVGPKSVFIGVLGSRLISLLNKSTDPLIASGGPAVAVVINLRNNNGAAAVNGVNGVIHGGCRGGPVFVTYSICEPTTVSRLGSVNGDLKVRMCRRKGNGPMRVIGGNVGCTGRGKCSCVLVSATNELRVSRGLVSRLIYVRGRVGPGRALLIVSTVVKRSTVGMVAKFGSGLGLAKYMLAGVSKSAGNKITLSLERLAGVPVGLVNSSRGLSNLDRFCPREVTSEVLNVKSVLSVVRRARRGLSRSRLVDATGGVREKGFSLRSFLDAAGRVGGLNPLRGLLGLMPNTSGVKLGGIGVSPGVVTHARTVMLSVAPRREEGPRVVGSDHGVEVTGKYKRGMRSIGELLGRFRRVGSVVGGVGGFGFWGDDGVEWTRWG